MISLRSFIIGSAEQQQKTLLDSHVAETTFWSFFWNIHLLQNLSIYQG